MTDSGIRVGRRRGYTVVYNDLLPEDGALSARAWGLYVYLVGRPEGWEARASHLQSVFKEGRDAIYKALGELVDHGLMEREQYAEPDSHLRRTRFVLPDDVDTRPRRSAPETDSQEPGTQEPEGQEPEKPGQVTTDPSTPEAPSTEEANDSLRSSSTTEKSKRGTRLPADWQPTEEMRQWFREQPFANAVNPVMETQKFVDYWVAQPGQRGVKLDWVATWRNWMRTAADRLRPRTAAPQHPTVGAEHRERVSGSF